jgi:hypothetical protein
MYWKLLISSIAAGMAWSGGYAQAADLVQGMATSQPFEIAQSGGTGGSMGGTTGGSDGGMPSGVSGGGMSSSGNASGMAGGNTGSGKMNTGTNRQGQPYH